MRAINRVWQIIKDKKLIPSNIEKQCGFSNGYLKRTLEQSSSMGEDALDKIAINLDISLNYLIRGNDSKNEPIENYLLNEPVVTYGVNKASPAANILMDIKEIANRIDKIAQTVLEFESAKSK